MLLLLIDKKKHLNKQPGAANRSVTSVLVVCVFEQRVCDAFVQRALVDARLTVAQAVRVQAEASLIIEPARSRLEYRTKHCTHI